jgi:hypothetical protein
LHQRLSRSVEGGLWRKVFHELLTDRNNRYLMIYSTIVQAHTIKRLPVAKGGSNKAPGYSRGGLTTETLLADLLGLPVDSSLSHTLGDTSAICRDCLVIAEDEKI